MRRRINRSPLPKYQLSRAASMRNKLLDSSGDYYKGSLIITKCDRRRNIQLETPETHKSFIKRRQEVLVIDQVQRLRTISSKNLNASLERLDETELEKIKEINKRRCKSSTVKSRQLNSRGRKRESLVEDRRHTTNIIPLDTRISLLSDFFTTGLCPPPHQAAKPSGSKEHRRNKHKPLKGKRLRPRPVDLPVGIHFTVEEPVEQPRFKERLKNRCEILFARGKAGRSSNSGKVARKNLKNLTSESIKPPLMKIVRPATANSSKSKELHWDTDKVKNFNTTTHIKRNNETNTSNEDILLRNSDMPKMNAALDYTRIGLYKSSALDAANAKLKKPSELFQVSHGSLKHKPPARKVFMNVRPFQINKTYCLYI